MKIMAETIECLEEIDGLLMVRIPEWIVKEEKIEEGDIVKVNIQKANRE